MARRRHGTVQDELKPSNAQEVYRVSRNHLPLHCPTPETYLWNSHPKVYLPIEEEGQAKCPYCSATYELYDVD